MPPPVTVKDVQKLNGLIASLGRFIARFSDKCKHFFNILKKGTKFEWTMECDKALQSIKDYLVNLSIMQKAKQGEEMLLYLASTSHTLSAVLLRSDEGVEKPIYYISKTWEILVDGSFNGEGNGIDIVFISPTGARMTYSFRLDFQSTNNETEYEVVVHALRLAIEMKIEDARMTSGSQLVIRQIEGIYTTNEPSMQKYRKLVMDLAMYIPKISWRHIGRKDNRLADALAFIPSIFGIPAQLVSDNGKQFEGENITMLLNAFKIQSGKSDPLYPQSNGQVEATNKTIADNLKKKLEGNNKGWCEQRQCYQQKLSSLPQREKLGKRI
ncbi:uncharacterized protein LOC113352279 [Papaver somniferum]|uniref:uncharacterized protein LOC113352279 n=1 Tax=Papaver somniferum TaxID=3469 RepID=UPI000E6FA1A5|nr:uncharacterized protein LOC113352279 [Papaver somniferum]